MSDLWHNTHILMCFLLIMGMIRERLDDSNTQLTSLRTTRSNHSLEREECNPKEMLALPIRRNTPSRLFFNILNC